MVDFLKRGPGYAVVEVSGRLCSMQEVELSEIVIACHGGRLKECGGGEIKEGGDSS